MALPRAAEEHYRAQAALTQDVTALATGLWRRTAFADLSGTYPLDALLAAVGTAQAVAATRAEGYLDAVLDETGQDGRSEGRVVPRAFVGASDGRALDALMLEPVIATKAAVGQGAMEQDAMRAGLASLLRIVGTQVQDAGRSAVGAGLVARPRIGGWVRALSLPACSRCAVLAGRWFRWNQGFQRHPLCDCRHIPASEDVAGDFTTDPRRAIESGQVRGLSQADRRAIVEDGADVGRVINAQRGMTTAAGRKATTEAARRGTVRLRPEAIYAEARDRGDAIRRLARYGYLT